MPDLKCGRCGADPGRFPAWIYDGDGAQPFCHKDGPERSCYTLANWDRTWATAAFRDLDEIRARQSDMLAQLDAHRAGR